MKLGELLLQEKIITEEQLQRALGYQRGNPEVRIGVALAKLGFADIKIVVRTLAKQRPLPDTQETSIPPKQETPAKGVPLEQSRVMMRLGETLLMENVITEEQLRKALEYQRKYPGTTFGGALIDLGFVTKKAISEALRKMRRGD